MADWTQEQQIEIISAYYRARAMVLKTSRLCKQQDYEVAIEASTGMIDVVEYVLQKYPDVASDDAIINLIAMIESGEKGDHDGLTRRLCHELYDTHGIYARSLAELYGLRAYARGTLFLTGNCAEMRELALQDIEKVFSYPPEVYERTDTQNIFPIIKQQQTQLQNTLCPVG